MRFLLLLACLAVVWFQPAQAEMFDDWTAWDLGREAAFLTFLVIDIGQTKDSYARFGHDDEKRWCDKNPIVGCEPSNARLNTILIGTAVAHILLTDYLDQPWRQIFQIATIYTEGVVALRNWSIGLRVRY